MARPIKIIGKKCIVCGVDDPSLFHPTARYYCKPCKIAYQHAHIEKLRREGDPNAAKKFWRKVKKGATPSDCWIWQGAVRPDGYAHFWFNGRTKYVHRVALELLGVVIPEGMDADHICQNRICVSPYHLRAVTERINAVENNRSPFAMNAQRTHCKKCGSPLSGDNIVRIALPPKRYQFKIGPTVTRKCLTCYPSAANSPFRVDKAA